MRVRDGVLRPLGHFEGDRRIIIQAGPRSMVINPADIGRPLQLHPFATAAKPKTYGPEDPKHGVFDYPSYGPPRVRLENR